MKRCRSIDYDQIHANNAIALMQYQMLAYMQRLNNDERTIGDVFRFIFEDDKNAEFEMTMNIVMALFAEKIADVFFRIKRRMCPLENG